MTDEILEDGHLVEAKTSAPRHCKETFHVIVDVWKVQEPSTYRLGRVLAPSIVSRSGLIAVFSDNAPALQLCEAVRSMGVYLAAAPKLAPEDEELPPAQKPHASTHWTAEDIVEMDEDSDNPITLDEAVEFLRDNEEAIVDRAVVSANDLIAEKLSQRPSPTQNC